MFPNVCLANIGSGLFVVSNTYDSRNTSVYQHYVLLRMFFVFNNNKH